MVAAASDDDGAMLMNVDEDVAMEVENSVIEEEGNMVTNVLDVSEND